MFTSILYGISREELLRIYDKKIIIPLLRNPLIIKTKEDLFRSKLYVGMIPFFEYKDNGDYKIELLSEEYISLMEFNFHFEEEQKQKENEKKEEDYIRRYKCYLPNELNEGDLVVFRDRENPNNVGKIKIINNKPYINGIEFDNECPFIKDVRIVENGFKPKDYFQNETYGFMKYISENSELEDKEITRTMRKSITF